jgi:hypothetical protein
MTPNSVDYISIRRVWTGKDVSKFLSAIKLDPEELSQIVHVRASVIEKWSTMDFLPAEASFSMDIIENFMNNISITNEKNNGRSIFEDHLRKSLRVYDSNLAYIKNTLLEGAKSGRPYGISGLAILSKYGDLLDHASDSGLMTQLDFEKLRDKSRALVASYPEILMESAAGDSATALVAVKTYFGRQMIYWSNVDAQANFILMAASRDPGKYKPMQFHGHLEDLGAKLSQPFSSHRL